MSNRLPAHVIDTATESRAKQTGFGIEQQIVKLSDINNVKFEWRVVDRKRLPGLHGSRERCVEMIASLQKRHVSSGYNAEFGYWWGHDVPEHGAVPLVVYRWVLV